MASVRFTELQSRPMEFLDFTSVTLDEFQQLVPPVSLARGESVVAGSGLPGVHAPPRRHPHADGETTGQELTLEQVLANQALHDRRLRIGHVNSSVKRCRMVKDRLRLWKQGVRDLVMELCCALHNVALI